MPLRAPTPASRDSGSTATGFLVAIVLIVAVGVAAFFYFGGGADVQIKKPEAGASVNLSRG